MINKEIEKIKQAVHRIQSEPAGDEQVKQIQELAKKVGASSCLHGERPLNKVNIDDITHNIHIALQTEMMLNACKLAERSCFWAAVAGIVACISVILNYLFMLK